MVGEEDGMGDEIRTALVEVERVVHETGIGPETMTALETAFGELFARAAQWKDRAMSIVVTDASQVEEMKVAREMRLALRAIRVEAERRRKELKAESLRKGKAIDGIANILKFMIEPLEEHLLAQEQFAERQEARRVAALAADRAERLRPFMESDQAEDVGKMDLGGMSEETYQALLDSFQRKHAEAQERQRRAAEEQAAKAKAEAEAKARLEEENRRLAEEAAKERAARLQAEKEAKAAKAAESRRKAAEEADRKRLERAPDSDRLASYAHALEAVPVPECQTPEGHALAQEIGQWVTGLVQTIIQRAAELPK